MIIRFSHGLLRDDHIREHFAECRVLFECYLEEMVLFDDKSMEETVLFAKINLEEVVQRCSNLEEMVL